MFPILDETEMVAIFYGRLIQNR